MTFGLVVASILLHRSLVAGRLDEMLVTMTMQISRQIFTVLRFAGRGHRDWWGYRSDRGCLRRKGC
jgi:hypothetical protein